MNTLTDIITTLQLIDIVLKPGWVVCAKRFITTCLCIIHIVKRQSDPRKEGSLVIRGLKWNRLDLIITYKTLKWQFSWRALWIDFSLRIQLQTIRVKRCCHLYKSVQLTKTLDDVHILSFGWKWEFSKK